MTTHFMSLKKEPFESIKKGTKNVEMRLYDDKRALLRVGDLIKFTLKDEGENINAEVIGLKRFDSFHSLYAVYDKVRLGYKEEETALPEDMLLFYPKEEVERFGVLAIEIKLL